MNATDSPFLSLKILPSLSHHQRVGELLIELENLRSGLIDLAYQLDTQGSGDAADVAITTAARLAEIHESFTAASTSLL